MHLTFLRRVILTLFFLGVWSSASAVDCLIFVHGKQTDTGTFTNWNNARSYWQDGSSDFIRDATKNFATDYYVVGYNGTEPYWGANAAGEVSQEIVNATNGIADGGGNRCSRTRAQGGTFWVVAHSMGNTVMDFVLGNNDSSDQNFNFNGPYSTAASNIDLVISTGGAHRGSEGADAVCGTSSGGCNFIAQFIQSCDTATTWLQSNDSFQVRTYSSSPAKAVYLTGGYEAIFGASACLSGEDDGVVQYASIFACGGSAGTSYNNSNACNTNNKQELSGFFNLDAAHENHNDERNSVDSDTRRQIPGGIWTCGGAPCAPNTVVQNNMSTGQFVAILY